MQRTLTVVQLLPALESGGVERSTLEIADALVRAGHRAIVVSAGGRLLPALQAPAARNTSHSTSAASRSPPCARCARCATLFARERVDIVHARSRLPAWIGWRALRGMAEAARPRFMTTVHGLNSPSRYSAIMARGERVVCVSDTVRDYVLRHYPRTDPAKLRVIPRGIDPAAFPPASWPDRAARARIAALHPQLGGNGPLLLLPGTRNAPEGPRRCAARCSARLRGDGIDARLWMPGAREADARRITSPNSNRRRWRSASHDALAITPPTSAIAEAYAASDLVLQLSRKPEAFGRTVIEALSVGRPVLGWAHGGVGELLRELQPRGAVAPFDADCPACARARLACRPACATGPASGYDARRDRTLFPAGHAAIDTRRL